MRSGRVERLALAILSGALSVLLSTVRANDGPSRDAADRPPRPVEESSTWRIEFDNDAIFHSDNMFTNGLSVQTYGPMADRWADVGGTPAFGKGLARWFLPDRHTDLLFREGWIIGQNLQTPEDIQREDLIVDDVPYAASLAVQNSWIAFDDERFYGFGWLLGVAGPAALGEEVQNGFHTLIGADDPKGWDNQLHNEPLLNVYYQRKRKLVNGATGDLAACAGAQAGNFFTGLDATLESRFGRRLPRGFLSLPDPVGRSLSYDSHLAPHEPGAWSFYGSVAIRATLVGHALFLDGNTFRDSHGVPHETLVGSVIAGLHYQRLRWGLHFHVWITTETVDPAAVAAEPDPRSDFGSLTVEFRR